MLVFDLSDYVADEDDLMHMMKVEAWSAAINAEAPLHTALFYVLPPMPAPPTRQMLPIHHNNNADLSTEFSKISTLIL